MRSIEVGEGIRLGASLELGTLFSLGDEDEPRFRKYADWPDGPFLRFFELRLEHPKSGLEIGARGGSLARDDRFVEGSAGVPGLFRARARFDGVPHDHARRIQPIHDGIGGDSLVLPAPLVPGANEDPELAAVLESRPRRSLVEQRDRTRVDLELWPVDGLKLFGSYALDDRDGERAFGGSLVFDTGLEPARLVEVVEPRSHRTHRFTVGGEVVGSSWAANVAYEGSHFENRSRSLTWENPFSLGGIAGAANVERGRMALAPDNEWHNVRGEVSFALAELGSWTSSVSWSRARQDTRLLPPTINGGIVGTPGRNAQDLDLWNDVAALSRRRADARVDTLLVASILQLRPVERIRLRSHVRFYEQSNETRYTARNPATGEIGYVAEDGAHAASTPFSRAFTPGTATDDFRYRSSPFDHRTIEAGLDARARLAGRTSIGARYVFERTDRDEREREETREHRFRADLTSRDISWATFRASYELRDRGGSRYDFFPNRDDYVSGLEGYVPIFGVLPPQTLAQLRKRDLASRRRHEAKLRLNLLTHEAVDVGLVVQGVFDDYGSEYGLRDDRRVDLNLDLGFQPSPRWDAHLFASASLRRWRSSGINDSAGFSSDPNAGGAIFPLDHRWTVISDENSIGGGAGLRWKLVEPVTLELDYRLLLTEGEIDFDAAGPGALAGGLARSDDLPRLRTLDHTLESSLRWALVERAALRFFYRYDHSTIRDYSQRDLDPSRAFQQTGALFLGQVDRDFDVHSVGLTLQLRL